MVHDGPLEGIEGTIHRQIIHVENPVRDLGKISQPWKKAECNLIRAKLLSVVGITLNLLVPKVPW